MPLDPRPGETAVLVAESTARPIDWPVVTVGNEVTAWLARSAVTIIDGPLVLLKSVIATTACPVLVFWSKPSAIGTPSPVNAGDRLVGALNVLAAMLLVITSYVGAE